MLTPFPSLLVYGFFVPTLLRVVVAICFVYIAYFVLQERSKLESIRDIPMIGRVQGWMVWASVVATLLVAFFLFIGLGTQWAALFGVLITLKHSLAPKRYREYLPLAHSTYLLLLIICVSLLLSGAGALAFDLPL